MRIGVVGAGCIGSVVAAHLARAGHEVTLIARGRRHAALFDGGLRVRRHGQSQEESHRLSVVDDARDAEDAELLIVAVQMQQVAALLPSLVEHRAVRVCFLLNVNPVPSAWYEALGARLVLGFPAMLAGYRGDVVAYRTLPSWLRAVMITTMGPPPGHDEAPARELVRLFVQAGLAAAFHPDMESWLATHSALVTPLMAFSTARSAVGRSLAMNAREAWSVASAMSEALRLVAAAGKRIVPANVALLPYTPVAAIASALWALSHVPWFERAVMDYAEHAGDEVRAMYAGLRARAGAERSPALDSLCAPLLSHQEASR